MSACNFVKFLVVAIVAAIGFLSPLTTVMAATPSDVIFTDPLYEDWKDSSQMGSMAYFDLNSIKGKVADVCGTVGSWTPGHAYDGHEGWDRNIPNDSGSYTVFAIGPGVVEKSAGDCVKGDKNCHGGAGNYVFIRHSPSTVSKIFHLAQDSVFVEKDQWIDRFRAIGLGGSTGNSSGEHVHVQIEIDGKPVDPVSLATQWSPPLVKSVNLCSKDPQHGVIQYQSLKEFVGGQMKTLSTSLLANGYALSNEQYWLLGTHGSDEKDLLVEDYVLDGKKSAIIYDLTGHAPAPIFMPHAVLKWWYENGSVYQYGRPLVSYSLTSGYTTEFDFEHGHLTYVVGPSGLIQSYGDYPELVGPGEYAGADPWLSGKSYAFITAFAKNGGSPKVGYPSSNNATTAYVHDWLGYSVQTYSGGSLGDSAIVLQNSSDNFQAFLIYGKFWTTYHSATVGPTVFGAPLNDAYLDTQFNMLRQDFEKGNSILESGEVVTSSMMCPAADATSFGSSCLCPGSQKQSTCGKCGIQQWSCANSMWTSNGTCSNEGTCSPNEQKSQSCGKCGNGIKTRSCMSNCAWNSWTSCNDPDSQKLCCEDAMNDCGGCKALPLQLYASCGNGGHYECNGKELLICKGEQISTPDTTSYEAGPDASSSGEDVYVTPDVNSTPDAVSTPDTVSGPDVVAQPDIMSTQDQYIAPDPTYNACGGTGSLSAYPGTSCGSCGATWQCSGSNGVICSSSGVCNPGESSSQSCALSTSGGSLCPAPTGTQQKVCTGSCQWQLQSCLPTSSGTGFAFDSTKVCGQKYCLQIVSASGTNASAKITKVGGASFGNMPFEWDVVNTTSSKILATPGTYCGKAYTGQSEISVTLNLVNVSGKAQAKANFYSGTNCADYESTPTVTIEKCQ